MSAHPSRRAFLAGAVGTLLRPLRVQAAGGRYTAAVRPARALLGQRVLGVLTVTAGESADVLTFDDPSLTVKLWRRGAHGEPQMTFPNHFVVHRGNVMLRTSRPRQPLRLRPGEHLERTFDLIQTFPDLALSTGDFEFAYEIGDDPRVTKSAATRLRIESGPDAVANVFGWLANDDLAVRESASFLLHRMTAYVAGYNAEEDPTARQAAIARWQNWWQTIGRALPWSFTTPGAVLDGAPVAPPPPRQRSKAVGGVRYDRRPLSARDARALAEALQAWTRDPAREWATLAAPPWAADRRFTYPPETSLVDPGEDAAAALEEALLRLSDLANSGSSERPEARALLAIVARMPQARFFNPLYAVEGSAQKNPAWRDALRTTLELLEILAPPDTEQ